MHVNVNQTEAVGFV